VGKPSGEKRSSGRERDSFFAAIGHTDDHHALRADWTAANRARAGGVDIDVIRCGWFWCATSEGHGRRWVELHHARRVVQGHGLDPWGEDAVRIANEYLRDTDLDVQKDQLVWVQARLRWMEAKLKAEIDKAVQAGRPKRDIALLEVRRSLERLEPKRDRHWNGDLGIIGRAREAVPDNPSNRPLDSQKIRALILGRKLGWKPADVAAILLLMGAVKGGFTAVRKQFVEEWRRHELRERRKLARGKGKATRKPPKKR
jgi:hypothetical protein